MKRELNMWLEFYYEKSHDLYFNSIQTSFIQWSRTRQSRIESVKKPEMKVNINLYFFVISLKIFYWSGMQRLAFILFRIW